MQSRENVGFVVNCSNSYEPQHPLKWGSFDTFAALVTSGRFGKLRHSLRAE